MSNIIKAKIDEIIADVIYLVWADGSETSHGLDLTSLGFVISDLPESSLAAPDLAVVNSEVLRARKLRKLATQPKTPPKFVRTTLI